SEQRVVVEGMGAIHKMMLVARSQHERRSIRPAQHNTIDSRWAMAATIRTGVVIFVPHNHKRRFRRAPLGGTGNLTNCLLRRLVPELDDAVIKARSWGCAGRQVQELRVRC